MKRARGPLLLAAALAVGATSCAARGYVPEAPSMPAARAALRPEHRLFYDALVDYGDWVLIEPFGFVFRPRVDFASFRPYQDGFWAPSDPWGWIWISAEPFGWATYHYGSWIWDRFQGWVWIPGVDWGPAWVSWQLNDQYAGWAPLGPRGGGGLPGQIPGGAYLYAPIDRMGATDLRAHVASEAALGAAVAGAEPVVNPAEHDGVRFDLGPPLERIERALGRPLQRVRIEETGRLTGRANEVAPASPEASAQATREAGDSAARQARSLIDRGGRTPANLPVLRPAGLKPADDGPPATGRPQRPGRGGAAADTTR